MVAAAGRPRLRACVDALAAARRTVIGPASARPAAPRSRRWARPGRSAGSSPSCSSTSSGSPRGRNGSTRRTSPCYWRFYDRARAEIERFGGTVEKFIGDAVMAVFGAPVAHGDDPERAVRAALAVRDAIAEMDFGDPLLELQDAGRREHGRGPRGAQEAAGRAQGSPWSRATS